MDTEIPFRISLLVVIILTMSATLYHRLQAGRDGQPVSRREEGRLFAVALRLAGFALWGMTIAYLVYPQSVALASFPIPTSIRWIGVIFGVFCSWLMYWTLSTLGTNFTDTVAIRPEATLITTGPYRWVRHPFYGSAALLMGAVTVLSANLLIGLASVIVLVLLAARTPKEEQKLIAHFGEDYRNYMVRTGRFLPRCAHRERSDR